MKPTAILSLVVLLCGAACAQQAKMATQFVSPTLFQLHDDKLQITYDISGTTPHFTYQDTAQKLEFSGDQIRKIENPELGTLISVTTRMTVDAGSTTFTLMVPHMNLIGDKPLDVRTYGMIVVHRFTVNAPHNQGELETYVAHELVGSAQHAVAK
jgi:hypothetical protein